MAILRGAVEIAATAENRAILVHSTLDFFVLRPALLESFSEMLPRMLCRPL